MNERIELTELKFQRSSNLALAVHLSDGVYYVQGMLEAALMIVSKIINEEVFELERCLHAGPPFAATLMSTIIEALPAYNRQPNQSRPGVRCDVI
jgi:hypothetical protein